MAGDADSAGGVGCGVLGVVGPDPYPVGGAVTEDRRHKLVLGLLIDTLAEVARDRIQMDSNDAQELLFRAGYLEEHPASEEEAERLDVDRGDPVYSLTFEAKFLRTMARGHRWGDAK